MNKREQRGFTNAIVEAGIRSSLTDSERRTLAKFEDVWDEGRDFTPGRTFDWFLNLCRRHRVTIRFMKKPSRRSGGGDMVEVEWSGPEESGSYWPPFSTGEKPNRVKRTVEQIRKLKADFRRECKLEHMKRLGISKLDYRRDLSDLAGRLDQLEARNRSGLAPTTTSTPSSSNVIRLPLCKTEPDLFTMPMADILALAIGEAA